MADAEENSLVTEGILPSCNFSKLPDEIIIKVFGLLDIYELIQIAEVFQKMERANQNFVFVENKKVPFNWRGKMVIGPTGELMMFTRHTL